ncbi:MAG: hypothetical protein HZC28_00040 [Spirochaetes bacterium]|nr:hypothetical protein [Spirochaetota bacterium]
MTAYGAKGDGDTKDTAAIQKAVDACADAGDGEVFFPKGVFLSGSIILKSGVTLFISPDAVMRGSTNIADYTKGALINAEDVEKTGIEGGGDIFLPRQRNSLPYFSRYGFSGIIRFLHAAA